MSIYLGTDKVSSYIHSSTLTREPILTSLTVTPGKFAQLFEPQTGVDGYSSVTVNGEQNLLAENIKNGVSIFGVTGSFAGITPTGTLNITANDVYDVTNYASVNVNVPSSIPSGYINPSGTYSITTNGTYNIRSYNSVSVNVSTGITPVGNLSITSNGDYNISQYATVNVNVPIPSGYLLPTGTLSITSNGSGIDVGSYKYVNVSVPAGIVPTGSLSITENGTYDITDKAQVVVQVETEPAFYAVKSASEPSSSTYLGVPVLWFQPVEEV